MRWPAFGDVHGEGLLLVPTGRKPVADVVAMPDADQTPEMLAGLVAGRAARVAVRPAAGRERLPRARARAHRSQRRAAAERAKLTNREFLYRAAFEMGRHLIGYEVQKVLAGVDWFAQGARATPSRGSA